MSTSKSMSTSKNTILTSRETEYDDEYHINLCVDYCRGFQRGLEPKEGWENTNFSFGVKVTCIKCMKSQDVELKSSAGHTYIKCLCYFDSFWRLTTDNYRPNLLCLPLDGSELTVIVVRLERDKNSAAKQFNLEKSVDLRNTTNEWVSVMKQSNLRYGKLIKTFQLTNGRFCAPPPTWEDPDYGFQFDLADWKDENRPDIVVRGKIVAVHHGTDFSSPVLAGSDAPRPRINLRNPFEAELSSMEFKEFRGIQVKTIDLISDTIKILCFNQCTLDNEILEQLTDRLHGLQDLKFIQCHLNSAISISSTSLKMLSVELCPGVCYVGIDVPSLETLVVISRVEILIIRETDYSSGGGVGEIETVFGMGYKKPPLWCSTLKQFAMIRLNKLEDYPRDGSSKIVAWFKRGSKLDFYILNEETASDWYDTFLSFGLSSLSQGVETLTLLVLSAKNFVFSFEQEGALCDLKTLTVEVIETMETNDFIGIVSHAIRRCPHISDLHIISAGDPNRRMSNFQFQYNPDSADNHQSCCRAGGVENLTKVIYSKLTSEEETCLNMILRGDNPGVNFEDREIGTVVHGRDEFYWEQVKLYAKREEFGD